MSIRLRLGLWYTAVLGLILVVFSLLVYFVMDRHFIDEGDQDISSRAQHVASSIRVDTTTFPSLQRVELPPIDAFESPGVYVQVTQIDGTVVAHSDNLGGQILPSDDQATALAKTGRAAFYTSSVTREKVRMYIQPLMADGKFIGFVQVGRSYSEAYAVLDRLKLGLLVVGMVSLVLAGAFAWGVAGGALKPIARITQTARAISLSKGFSRRLEGIGSHDELGQLGVTLNEMLASLEEAYGAQQRFTADASHELRTPLTAMRANLELLDKHGDNVTDEERKELVRDIVHETDRMIRLVTSLLSLARADAGQNLSMRQVELDSVVLNTYGEVKPLARGVKFVIKEIDEVSLIGNVDYLKQMIMILVDNAFKYTPPGGEVSLSLSKEGATASLIVADNGFGIATGDLPHVFERFYRADQARALSPDGTGLGLAISKWIVQQHGGDIAVESSLNQGTVLIVRFPLPPKHGYTQSRPLFAT
ncbi:MAG: ATP-binding protein [Candidatus Marsarchaeota archaeon]|nr:ATP-binding protein [Candidatus Marsarchaeota archaeon]